MAVALIVAAGRGERLGSDRPKALVTLAGQADARVERRDALARCRGRARSSSRCRRTQLDAAPAGTDRRRRRRGAVASRCARRLRACGSGDPVIVHDAARPLAPRRAVRARAGAARVASGADAVVAAAPVADTIKEVGDDGRTVHADARSLAAVGGPDASGVPPRGARARAARGRRRAARRRHRRRVADRARRRGGARWCESGPREPQGHDSDRSASWPSCCWSTSGACSRVGECA